MKVQVYKLDTETGEQKLQAIRDLNEQFPDRDAQYHVALVELNRMGRCWCKGPVLLVRQD